MRFLNMFKSKGEWHDELQAVKKQEKVDPYATHTSRPRVVSEEDAKRLFAAWDFAQCAGEDDACTSEMVADFKTDARKMLGEIRTKYGIKGDWGINRDGSIAPPRVMAED